MNTKHLKRFQWFYTKTHVNATRTLIFTWNPYTRKKRAYISSDHNRILSEKKGKGKKREIRLGYRLVSDSHNPAVEKSTAGLWFYGRRTYDYKNIKKAADLNGYLYKIFFTLSFYLYARSSFLFCFSRRNTVWARRQQNSQRKFPRMK